MRHFLLISLLIVTHAKLSAQNSLPSTGYVGINTTSPHAPLHVVGGTTITAGWNKTAILEGAYPILLMNSANHKWGGIGYDHSTAMRFWVNSSSDDLPLHGRNPLTILNNGYVGVGTGNPNGQLHVNSEVSNALMVSRYGSNTYGFEIGGATFGLYDYTNTAYKWMVNGENLLLNPYSGKIGIGTLTPATLVHLHEEADKDTYLHMTNINTGKQSADGLELSANRDLGANVWNYENGYLRFATNNAEQMRITNDGRMGIGISNPVYKMDIRSVGTPIVNITPLNGTEAGGFRVGNNGNTSFFVNENNTGGSVFSGASPYATVIGNFENRPLQFATSTFVRMTISSNGNALIGTATDNGTDKLQVNGSVKAKKITISQTGWPDYVFDSSYSLRPLSAVQTFIAKHKRLPDMPSAKDVEEKGVDIGDQQVLLLKKIEELTLYVLQLQARIKKLESSNEK
ncbi:hypothetical protein [Sediminibacterium sp.]|uniref:hypothetical protein n=1 Tax=Sediminibacterium sp. TaxID=1917865 RepID=UPI0025E1A8C0|nr:hypothetical protein [Sediminibacterium sp.]MBW0177575.1 hypothetical protein [Sediminibacterium sp.]